MQKKETCWAQMVACCIDCCINCIECIIQYINRQAMIWTAIYGEPYCVSLRAANLLIFSNLGDAMLITILSTLVVKLGKYVVPFCTTGFVALVLVYGYNNAISEVFSQLAINFIISYAIAHLMLLVYDVGIDTMFLCYLLDKEVNKTPERMLAGHEITKTVFNLKNFEDPKKPQCCPVDRCQPGYKKDAAKGHKVSKGTSRGNDV